MSDTLTVPRKQLWVDTLPDTPRMREDPDNRPTSFDGMTFGFEIVTPDKAAEYLAHLYKGQRSKSSTDVKKWAKDMTDGRWGLSPDAIAFGVDGTLMNGQHRIHAVAMSGTSQPFAVIRGCPSTMYRFIDTGRKRGFHVVLGGEGEVNAADVGAAVRLLARWSQFGTLGQRSDMSSPMLFDFFCQHPGLRDSVAPARRVYNRYKFSKASLIVLHYLFAIVDVDAADEFFDLLDRQAAPEGSPVHHLQRALTARMATRLSGDDPHYVALTIKAWNAHRSGASMRRLYHRSGDPLPEIHDPDDKLGDLLKRSA